MTGRAKSTPPAVTEHRLAHVEKTLDEHKIILQSVATSLEKFTRIEEHLASLVKEAADFRIALHGDKDSKGLFTRMAEQEARLGHHTKLWLYVGGSVGGGIMWGIAQICAEAWSALRSAAPAIAGG